MLVMRMNLCSRARVADALVLMFTVQVFGEMKLDEKSQSAQSLYI